MSDMINRIFDGIDLDEIINMDDIVEEAKKEEDENK